MRALALLLFATLGWALAACAPAAPPPEAPSPALWRIRDADSEIWLFGTVHVLPEHVRWRTPALDAAFAAADALMVETDVADQAGFAAAIAPQALLPADARLPALLDGDAAARLARVAAGLGIDPDSLARTRPWLAALRLSTAFAEARGHRAAYGVETVLTAEARAAGKPVRFLESPHAQIEALAGLSRGEEIRFLAAALRQMEQQPGALEAIDAAWARGDVQALEALMNADLAEAGPNVRARLISARNRRWADEIAAELDGAGRVFIAVGAAHLVGADGVPALLRARGIAVEGP